MKWLAILTALIIFAALYVARAARAGDLPQVGDDTPACTQETCAFRDDMNRLTEIGAQVVGISVVDSHAKFAAKHHLPFALLADTDGSVANSYGALLNLGIMKTARRFTFLIDPKGNISKRHLTVETSRHSKS